MYKQKNVGPNFAFQQVKLVEVVFVHLKGDTDPIFNWSWWKLAHLAFGGRNYS